jgi:hypothetical protein
MVFRRMVPWQDVECSYYELNPFYFFKFAPPKRVNTFFILFIFNYEASGTSKKEKKDKV